MQLSKLMKENLEKAEEQELTSSNNLLLQVGNALKSLPADKVAKASIAEKLKTEVPLISENLKESLVSTENGYYSFDYDLNKYTLRLHTDFKALKFKVEPLTWYALLSEFGYSMYNPQILLVDGEGNIENTNLLNKITSEGNSKTFLNTNSKYVIVQVRSVNQSDESPVISFRKIKSLGFENYEIGEFWKEESGKLVGSGSHDWYIKKIIPLKAYSTYKFNCYVSGTAKTFLCKKGTNEISKIFNSGVNTVETNLFDYDLYICSKVFGSLSDSQVNINSDVYPFSFEETFDIKRDENVYTWLPNRNNVSAGWYNSSFVLNDNTVDIEKNYGLIYFSHSKPIKVNGGCEYEFSGLGISTLNPIVMSCSQDGTPNNSFVIKGLGLGYYTPFKTTFVIPKNVDYIIIQGIANGGLGVSNLYLKCLGKVSSFGIVWEIPDIIYAIKGVEKSLYYDCVANTNDYCPSFHIESTFNFGASDGKRFYFTPDTTGDKTITLKAFANDGTEIGSKVVKFRVLDNVVSSDKNVVCIGSSSTEVNNMPYYIQQGLISCLTSESVQPTFVGHKGGTSGMGGKPTKHEGYYGQTYSWLATNESSPFVRNGSIDIANYCSSLGISKIDVVSLAMGMNGTESDSGITSEKNAMDSLISAIKNHNANAKFVIQMPIYYAYLYALQTSNNNTMLTNKKNWLAKWRQIVLSYQGRENENIFVGDWGLSLDRWFAFPKEVRHPASMYVNDNVEHITDPKHCNVYGSQQMGENTMHSLLKALQ